MLVKPQAQTHLGGCTRARRGGHCSIAKKKALEDKEHRTGGQASPIKKEGVFVLNLHMVI